MEYSTYFEANKTLWDRRTAVHKDSDFYDVASFLKGRNTLNKAIELKEIGDVSGKKLLHLQCHFGLDTLSWARLGAEVTGVDLSPASIAEAKRLSEESGLPAKFICCNVYDLEQHLNEKFDIVFTSYGTITWLPDLDKWAGLISHYLKTGGFFYLAEFHPVVWMFDEQFESVKYYYHNQEVIEIQTEETYTGHKVGVAGPEYSWNHSLSEVINALISNGLKLEFLNEFSWSPYSNFPNSVKGEDGNYRIMGMEDKIPMVYSLKARRNV